MALLKYVNPLYRPLEYNAPPILSSIAAITSDLVKRYEGLDPVIERQTQINIPFWDKRHPEYHPRIVAKWRIPSMDEAIYRALEQIFRTSILDESPTISKADYKRKGFSPAHFMQTNGHLTGRIRGFPIYERSGAAAPSSSESFSREEKILWVAKEYQSVREAKEDLRRRGNEYWFNSEGDFFVELKLQDCKELEFIDAVLQTSVVLAGNYERFNRSEALAVAQKQLARRDKKTVVEHDLIGLETIIENLKYRQFMATVNPVAAKALGVTDESVLLVGVPGCGKTSIASALLWDAALENIPFLTMEVGELLEASYSSDKEVNTFFTGIEELHRRYGLNIRLWCDDLEAAFIEDGGDRKISAATQSVLLNRLRGVSADFGVKLSGSTNLPERIDQRFLEFGRISYMLHVPIPHDPDVITGILARQISLRGQMLGEGLTPRDIAEKISGYTPNMMVKLINEAGVKAGERIFGRFANVASSTDQPLEVRMEDYDKARTSLENGAVVDKLRKRDEELAKFVRTRGGNELDWSRPGVYL